MRAVPTALAAFVLSAFTLLLLSRPTPAVTRPPESPRWTGPAPWAPPAWFPSASNDLLWTLPALDQPATSERGPSVRARAAIVADLDRMEVLWSRAPDLPRPVASLTKMVSALTLARQGEDLDQRLSATVCITPEQWPPLPGAPSRFETGTCHEGWELLGAALVASDNRGAMGLAAVAGLPVDTFVQEMDATVAELGMKDARFADPSGVEDANVASARDVLKAVVAVAAHPVLADVASAREWRIDRERGDRLLGTTNRLIDRFETLAAKTGYTDPAGYCLASVVRTRAGRTLAAVVLGAPTNQSRFHDTEALLRWAESQ